MGILGHNVDNTVHLARSVVTFEPQIEEVGLNPPSD